MPPEAAPILDPSCRDCTLLESTESLRRKIAEELERLRDDMEELGVQLCMDEDVMLRCMTQLQKLDEMGQRCHWLAEVIRADDPSAVVPSIGLESLGKRLS